VPARVVLTRTRVVLAFVLLKAPPAALGVLGWNSQPCVDGVVRAGMTSLSVVQFGAKLAGYSVCARRSGRGGRAELSALCGRVAALALCDLAPRVRCSWFALELRHGFIAVVEVRHHAR